MATILTVEDALQHPERFRVSIFGSAKTMQDSSEYKKVFDLAKTLGAMGDKHYYRRSPGVMEAANSGLKAGTNGDAKFVGLTVDLPWGQWKMITSTSTNISINFPAASIISWHFLMWL